MVAPNSTLDREILQILREVTRRAILPRFRNLGAGEIIEKSKDDLVTIADREAEAMLTDRLSSLDPSLAIVGEEAAHADPGVLDRLSSDCWIIDPVDGTRNFAKGRAPFGILIALARNGMAERGWIYDCLTGRLCSAQRGSGAWIDGAPFRARPTGETPPVAALATGFLDNLKRAHFTEHVAPHFREVPVPYCAAEQYPRLALGANDVAYFERTLAWDHAAGALWLNEAGGMAARPDGSAYRVDEWDRPGLIGAATPALWEKLARRL